MDSRQRNILLDHLPEKSLELAVKWLEEYHVSLTITRKRNTKMGDYRPPLKKSYHRISVNGDLHPLAFLVTLVHELAHLVIWEKYQRKVRPHGEEWKRQFRNMLQEVLMTGVFQGDEVAIIQQFVLGKMSYRTFNQQFERNIHEKDPGDQGLLLSELPLRSIFSLYNGRRFVKMEKLRTRYRCREVRSGRLFLISGMAKVHPHPDQG
jgi:hypothetical protein